MKEKLNEKVKVVLTKHNTLTDKSRADIRAKILMQNKKIADVIVEQNIRHMSQQFRSWLSGTANQKKWHLFLEILYNAGIIENEIILRYMNKGKQSEISLPIEIFISRC